VRADKRCQISDKGEGKRRLRLRLTGSWQPTFTNLLVPQIVHLGPDCLHLDYTIIIIVISRTGRPSRAHLANGRALNGFRPRAP